jgi:signal transduction histidine kinase
LSNCIQKLTELAENRRIEAAAMEHLFEPFFTGFDTDRHSTGTFEHGTRGLGLGLSVVKAFVDMHGGTVSARRTEQGGMAFVIDLPGG